MDEAGILEELFDKKIIRVLKVLFKEKDQELYLQEVSSQAKVAMASCSRILAKLERLGIVAVKKVSRIKLYSIAENKKTHFLSKLFKEDLRILQKFVREASGIEGVDSIILHGKEAKDKANILLIGENINPGSVKKLCSRIKDELNFVISPLSLTREQYMQMSQMGLYSGQKKLLFEKNV